MHYQTQHAPNGALASFTIGLPGARGGFGQSLSGPAQQNVYIGYRQQKADKTEPWSLLPFFQPKTQPAAAAFTVEFAGQDAGVSHMPRLLDIEAVERRLGWASDAWSHQGFAFRLYSPFGKTESPESMSAEAARLAFAPVVMAEIAFDNSQGTKPVELIFGIGDHARRFRPLEDCTDALLGFAMGTGMGFATLPDKAVGRMQGLDIFAPQHVRDLRGLHLLGPEAALTFRIEPGEARSFPLALGFYVAGTITTGLKSSFYYTRLFPDLEAVLQHGLASFAHYKTQAEARDTELATARHLDENQRWLIAQATHSYLGSTELLWDEKEGRPLWVVNEGEYLMLNTFDLTVDHLFYELAWQPWAVRNAMDQFTDRYAYYDEIAATDTKTRAQCLSFTHDMGVADHFTEPGYSSYECTNIDGCFSQMTMEQLINWVCCAATYSLKTGDLAWLKQRADTFAACADSLLNRDHPEPDKRTGLLKWDSSRCGDGAEITTYDSLDVSLGQARNNLYLSVKAFAAWTLLERIYDKEYLNNPEHQQTARAAADLAAQAISERFEQDTGMFPAVFEKGNQSRILPAIEGLVFPQYLGFVETLRERYPTLFQQLAQHMQNVLQPGICLESNTGAWKISSTSKNTWFSKIALSQHVMRTVFPDVSLPDSATTKADAAHARLQQAEPLGKFAMVDQFDSTNGESLGSRYYPRGVTACLWL